MFDKAQAEIMSYISNRRDLRRLLIAAYPPSEKSPLIVQSVKDLPETMHVIDPCDVSVHIQKGNSMVEVPLQKGKEKTNLVQHCSRQKGCRFLIVKGISVKTANGKVVTHQIKTLKYVFANEKRVSPLVNAETAIFQAGFVSIKKSDNGLLINIPIAEHLDITTPKSASGYLSLSAINTCSRLESTQIPLLHRPNLGDDPFLNPPAIDSKGPSPMLQKDVQGIYSCVC